MEASAVRKVTVIATGAGAGHPEHVHGTKKPALWWIFTSKRSITLPISVFVVEHDDGLVLFDTGADPAVVTDPDYWPDRITRLFMSHIFDFEIGSDDGLASQLERAGYDAADVTKAVLSHLHFDHAGGIGDIPGADLLVAGDAWQHMLGAHPEREGVLRRDIAVPGAHWQLLEFEPTSDPALAPFTEAHDVMGDGSLMVVATPGHLPGAVSMLVRRRNAPPVLLVGDLTYSVELLERDQVAGTGDKKLLRQSFAKVRALRAHTPELVVVASHERTAAARLAAEAGGPHSPS